MEVVSVRRIQFVRQRTSTGPDKVGQGVCRENAKREEALCTPNPKAKNVRGTGVGAQPKFHTGDLSLICLSEICSSKSLAVLFQIIFYFWHLFRPSEWMCMFFG